MSTGKRLRCLWSLFLTQTFLMAFSTLPAAAQEIEANSEIPTSYQGDKTMDVLRVCGRGKVMACRPILADEGKSIIASEPIKSWSLFLVCTPGLLRDSNSSSLASLFDRFMAFGRALGKEHAAVWFVKKKTGIQNPAALENLDIDRNVTYCSKFKLAREDGPHVIVTTQYPKLKEDLGYQLILSLGGMSEESIENLLAALATQVGNEQLDQFQMDSKVWIQTLKQASNRALASIGDIARHSKLTIKARGIETTLEPTAK